ncbi:ATP-dependent Clp protease proteolytic subunit [Halobacteriovorax sp. JY17]|uniref:NfeD family protein n=1 Tax=Halobacteriovorax sp. JY17 TaxID=2014617 RepID=UPI0025BFBA67|nr:ATP-dependent Clp protease proteolytic subunit [Halobacteriovorax sp. JY17]
MKTYQILLILTISLFTFFSESRAQDINIKEVLELSIDSPITPATFNYLEQGFKRASKQNSDAILIKLNTPGGLVSTTKEILTLIGESKKPVMVWISPEGASATSAGAIIASAAHILLMSEGTNIGAATPIQMSGDIEKSDVRSKSVNDLKALVQSLAQTRGRNAKLFGDMIEKASSFEARVAKEKNLVDDILNQKSKLESVINNRMIHIQGEDRRILAERINYSSYEMDLGQKLLNIFANPNTAYILFLIGAALIYLEFQAPGGFIAGSIGALSLLLAAIGFQVLPLNFGAMALIILGFVLFIIEIYITSYGILSLAGLASFVSGSLFLLRTDDSYIVISQTLVISASLAISLFLIIVGYFLVKDHKNIGKTKFNSQLDESATVVAQLGFENNSFKYQVKLHGEVWNFESTSEYQVGDVVKVKEQTELCLKG